ncbi:MAG: hypothetical protein JSU94_02045 [Phycisphaerales bacterium]|nr:MAG: hypothetical protein JSU94_02045 [Phycisphaerales bacterium]
MRDMYRVKDDTADTCRCRMKMVLSLGILACAFVCGARAQGRATIVLKDNWYVKQLENDRPDVSLLAASLAKPDGDWLNAKMPAQVHDVLLSHGRISDPHVGKNAGESAWVAEKDWAYACRFASPSKAAGPVFLRFDGLDTLAAAYLNGSEIGRFDNMYREYCVEVADKLAPPGRDNVLLIVFSSPLRYVNDIERPDNLRTLAKHKWLRKCHSDFSSYLGARPHSVKVGVYKDIWLDIPGSSWIEDLWIRAEISPDMRRASVRVQIKVAGDDAAVEWILKDPSGSEISRGAGRTSNGKLNTAIDLKAPQLWWPRTHGTPHLYQLQVTLTYERQKLDARSVRFGIRDVKPVLKDPQTGENRFRFDINGQPIFLKGACWAPLEGMTHCWDSERGMRLLDLFEHAHMNVMRIWGEGYIPPQQFYEECDRRGILIWQDFMFGYNMHPSGDPNFDANCRAEIEEMIRSLRNHPCILLWAGGNENHMGWNFSRGTKPTVGLELFEQIMPQACAKLDPGRLFHPSSPYGGRVPNWPLEGDWHDYTTLKFSPEASVPLFASEVGRVSAPSVTSMRRFMSEQELWPEGHKASIAKPGDASWPPMWQYRSVGGSWDKIGPIERYCEPTGPEAFVRMLGAAHGEYLQQRVERERRGLPDGGRGGSRRCWGNMVWRLNDSWPIIYWSVIDYYLEPKIPFYFLRRAYEPVLVCFEQTADRIAVWVVNDSPQPVSGTLEVQRRRFDGRSLGRLETSVKLQPAQAERCLVTTDLGPVYLRNEFLQASFAGRDATYLLAPERYLHLPKARLTAKVSGAAIEVSTDNFARQVTLQLDGVTGAVFEDNYFDMPPGQKRIIRVIDAAGGSRLTISAVNAGPLRLQLN